MERVSIITHESIKLVFLNAKDLKDENELCRNIDRLADTAIKNRIKFFLIDVTGTHTTPKVQDTAKKAIERSKSQLGQVYSSLVGLSALQRIIANAINREQYFASSIDDAKKWLLSKAK
jgi:hypothetical protein